MSSDDNQIDVLTLGDLEQRAFRMPPARRDSDRHLFRWQSHRDVFIDVALEKVLDLFRIFCQRERPVKSQSLRLVRRPVDMQHARRTWADLLQLIHPSESGVTAAEKS